MTKRCSSVGWRGPLGSPEGSRRMRWHQTRSEVLGRWEGTRWLNGWRKNLRETSQQQGIGLSMGWCTSQLLRWCLRSDSSQRRRSAQWRAEQRHNDVRWCGERGKNIFRVEASWMDKAGSAAHMGGGRQSLQSDVARSDGSAGTWLTRRSGGDHASRRRRVLWRWLTRYRWPRPVWT
jgi:hypothetical protein